MKWCSAMSESPHSGTAVHQACAEVEAGLAGASADVVWLFASPHHAGSYAELAELVMAQLPAGVLVGCSGGGIVGDAREIERAPALSITAAHLPGVDLRLLHLEADDLPARDDHEAWQAFGTLREGAAPGEAAPNFIVLADPFGFPIERLLRGLDRHFPGATKVGGLVSGGEVPGSVALFTADGCQRRGALLLVMGGALRVDTVVAQGCRPIGEPMIITGCQGQLVSSLGNKNPVEVVRELHGSLDTHDQQLFRHSLFAGIEMRDQREYHAGDFLIRNVIGIDADAGLLALAARPKQYQAMQFHLRDRRAASEDLQRQLERHRERRGEEPPAGALLFSCLGRGEGLYEQPNHDSECLTATLGETALGGFFCNGEIGQVGEKTYLHGYTSAVALFYPGDAGAS